MKIADYMILSETSDSELAKKVREYISEGWEPLGGVSYGSSHFSAVEVFVQAMIKREK